MTQDHTVTVTILGKEIVLATPSSHALRWDISTAAVTSPQRALAAALCACWPRRPGLPGETRERPRPSMETSMHSVGAFGGRVIDWLIAEGVSMPEIMHAGTLAYGLIQDGLYTDKELQEAEDFSEAPEGPSTG